MSEIDNDDIGRSPSFSLKVWKKLVPHYKPYKKYVILAILNILIMAAFDVLLPVFQRMIINNNVEPKSTEGLWLLGLLYASVISLQALMTYVAMRVFMRLDVCVCRDLRNGLFIKYQKLPVSYYSDKSVGYLVAKTISDTERVAGTVAWNMLDLGWALIYIIGLFIPMFIVNWKIALALAVLIPIGLLISVLFSRRLLNMNRHIRKSNSVLAGALNEGISGAKTAKTLVAGDLLIDEFNEKSRDLYKKSVSYARFGSFYRSLLSVVGAFAVAAVIAIGGMALNSDAMPLGDISMFLSYSFSLVWPMMSIGQCFTNIVANQANVERIYSVLDAPLTLCDSPEVIEKYGDEFNPKYENWEKMDGEIEFKNVSFKYPGSNTYVLENFNLIIPKNTSCALVGETGAGKTTIVSLLCRFYEPTSGEILIDGTDYRLRSLGWLSQNIGYVLQTPHLFSGTIRENIRYGKDGASDTEIEKAAQITCVDKIAAKLEKGLDIESGEGGDRFSTGEKQLISFARAIIADPRVLILDEATASIDTQTEHMVQTAIEELLKNRTSITIAHRLSTIKKADNILVIDEGKIAERGTHSELLSKKGRYYELYRKLSELETADAVLNSEKIIES